MRISTMIQFAKKYEGIGIKTPAWASLGRQTLLLLAVAFGFISALTQIDVAASLAMPWSVPRSGVTTNL